VDPNGLQFFTDLMAFFTALLVAASAAGCEECDGGAAAAGLLAAIGQLVNDFGDTFAQDPWIDGGECDPCD
jgi:hypothetical protein